MTFLAFSGSAVGLGRSIELAKNDDWDTTSTLFFVALLIATCGALLKLGIDVTKQWPAICCKKEESNSAEYSRPRI